MNKHIRRFTVNNHIHDVNTEKMGRFLSSLEDGDYAIIVQDASELDKDPETSKLIRGFYFSAIVPAFAPVFGVIPSEVDKNGRPRLSSHDKDKVDQAIRSHFHPIAIPALNGGAEMRGGKSMSGASAKEWWNLINNAQSWLWENKNQRIEAVDAETREVIEKMAVKYDSYDTKSIKE